MSHLRLIAAVAVGTLVGSSSAWAMPVQASGNSGSNVVLAQYCPPGYKVTSHGGCKMSDYLRHHPGKNPYNYQRYNYNDPYQRQRYDYDQPRYRRHYYGDDQDY